MSDKLTFPTQAEQALAEWQRRAAVKTTSITTVCMERGADRSDDYPWRLFTFDDDTVLAARGAGRNLVVETRLP